MRLREERRLQMLIRVCEFADAHCAHTDDASVPARVFDVVRQSVNDARASHALLKTTARAGIQERIEAREALVAGLTVIWRTARAIAQDIPAFDEPYRLPARRTDEDLLTLSQLRADEVRKDQSQFVSHRLPPTCADDFEALVARFHQVLRDDRDRAVSQMVARKTFVRALSKGLAAAARLDAILSNEFASRSAELALWKQARMVGHPRS